LPAWQADRRGVSFSIIWKVSVIINPNLHPKALQ